MTKRIRQVGIAAPAVGIAAGLYDLIFGGVSMWSLFLLPTNAALLALNVYLYRKDRHGSNRQAQEGASDPRTGDITLSFNSGGTVNSGGSLTAAIASTHANHYPSLTTGGVNRVNESEVERVESDMPILAHRIARLRFDGKQPFASLNEGGRFGIDADAICTRWDNGFRRQIAVSYGMRAERHDAPSLGCACGFYALPSDIEPWDEGSDYVTLLVELSGTVIEHEKGYRAQHQRVVECQIPACPFCRRQADVVLAQDAQMGSVACTAHVPPSLHPGTVAVAVSDLSDLLGVPVSRLGTERA